MIRLTRLRIERFRNIKPGTDLRFGPTFNVLLGKNATGKSTLLDLVAAVTNDDLSSYSNEDAGFDLTWWLEQGDHQIEQHAVRELAKSAALPVRIGEEKDFDDVLTLTLRTAGRETDRIVITGTRGVWSHENQPDVTFDLRSSLATGRAGLRALFAAFRKQPKGAVVHDTLDMFLGWDGAGRFDEALVTLHAITGARFERNREGTRDSGGQFSRWFPRAFLISAYKPASLEPLVIPFSDLSSLEQIPGILGFASAQLRPRVLTRTQDAEKVRTIYQGFDCLFQRADGSQISHELLSFGQKRLFAFLWYLAVREKLPVVADELLNGLHHEWIEICFERLRDRQSFLATQHPLLLDHIPVESAEGARTTFVRCSIENGADGREQLAWRNLDVDEAERFFVAYQTGIQQVSEVLRSEGLW